MGGILSCSLIRKYNNDIHNIPNYYSLPLVPLTVLEDALENLKKRIHRVHSGKYNFVFINHWKPFAFIRNLRYEFAKIFFASAE